MKLATYEIQTAVGPFQRIGAVVPGPGTDLLLIDLNFAHAAQLAERGKPDPTERAGWLVPPEMTGLAGRGQEAMDAVREALEFVTSRWQKGEVRGPRGEQVVWALAGVRLLPPVLRPPVLRDFAAFEDHLANTFGKMGVAIPPAWYERPMAFKGNPTSLVGHDAEVVWPRYGEKLDYEMEVGAVIGTPGRNIDVDRAEEFIFGYTILNDFSARDTQRGEMQNHTGPFKGKDFAWGLGPWIVTRDEIKNPLQLRMAVRINGETWAESTPGAMQWTFPQMISYTSQDETLNAGDIFGSGTVNHGCGFEIDRWIQPGDLVEVEIESIGVLRHRMGRPARNPVNWRG